MTPTEQAADRVKASIAAYMTPGVPSSGPQCSATDLETLLSALTALQARLEEAEKARDRSHDLSLHAAAELNRMDREAAASAFLLALMAAAAEPLEGLSAAEWKAEYLRRHEDVCQMMDHAIAAEARVGELEGALKELASEDFAGPPGVSIYAAAANELPRRIKLAQAALLTPPLEQE